MIRIYRPPWYLLNISNFPHRWFGRPLRIIVNGQLLVLRFLRVQFKLPLPRIRPFFMEVLEILDEERLGNTRFKMRGVHDLGRGIRG